MRPISGLAEARIARVNRGSLAAYMAATAAVSARTPEVEFLRARHELYRGTAPRDVTAPIPDTEISSSGDFVIAEIDRRHPSDRVFDGPTADARQDSIGAEIAFQTAAAEAAGVEVGRRAAEIDEDVQRIDRQLLEIDEQLDRLTTERNDVETARTHAIERGSVDLTPTRVPSAARILGLRLCEGASIATECSAFFFAVANTNGVDPTNLRMEWMQGAGFVIVGSALAACVTAGGVFILAEAVWRHVAASMREGASYRAMQRWGAGLLLLFISIVLITIAAMRAELGMAGETSFATIARYLILVAVPLIAGTYLHALIGQLAKQRCTALTPDPLDVAAKHRREQETRLMEERERLRTQREILVGKRNALNASVFGGDMLVRDLARHEMRVVDEFLDSLRSAVAIDRAAFRFVARVFGRDSLLATPQLALVPMRRGRRTA